MRVDSTRNTVLHLGIKLRKSVLIIDTGFLNIPNSCLFHNVPDKEPLDGLVLRAAFAAVGTADKFHVSASMLVASTIPALESHGS